MKHVEIMVPLTRVEEIPIRYMYTSLQHVRIFLHPVGKNPYPPKYAENVFVTGPTWNKYCAHIAQQHTAKMIRRRVDEARRNHRGPR